MLPRTEFMRRNLSSKLNSRTPSQSNRQQKIDRVAELMATFLSSFVNQNQKNMKQQSQQCYQQEQIQQRQREVKINIPLIKENQDRIHEMKKFLADVVNIVTAKGFYYLQKKLVNQQRFKLYCCKNMLLKIIKFSKENKLTLSQLQKLDQHLQKKVLPFAKYNYPKSQAKGSNIKLASMINDINNMNSNANDLIFCSGVKFRLKQSSDYSTEILSFINYLIQVTKEKGDLDQVTLYGLFYREMEDIFNNLEDEEWVLNAKFNSFKKQAQYGRRASINQNINQASGIELQRRTSNNQAQSHTFDNQPQKYISQSQKQKQNYKQKVREYTKYRIGKKIPSHIHTYTQSQISQQCPDLQNPSLMRIIAKWIQQLTKWFQQDQYILDKQEMFRMRDGSECYLSKDSRIILLECVKDQSVGLRQFFVDLLKNNSFNHFRILQEKGQQYFREFVRKQDSQCAYFATVIKKCYSNYLMSYLNKLIDCLLRAQHKFSIRLGYQNWQNNKIPTLISFNVGDLMRCKCSSKQLQITSLYSYLKYLSDTCPQKLQILRIKNRLNLGTKDILINFRYMNKIVIQMQLSIDGDKSYFIECSQKANHFLYQLQRACYGPLTQICSIFLNLDQRSELFKKAFDQTNKSQFNKKAKTKCQHHMVQYNLPIWCTCCGAFSANLSMVAPHRKCQKCMLFICSKCYVDSGQQIEIGQTKLKRQKLSQIFKICDNKQVKQIRAVDLNKKIVRIRNYYIAYINNKYIIYEQPEKGGISILRQLKRKQLLSFFNGKHLIASKQKTLTEGQSQLLSDQLFMRKLSMTEKNQKTNFTFQEDKINMERIKQRRLLSVVRLNLRGNELSSIWPLSQVFENCKKATLNNNKIIDFKGIENWCNLQQLDLQNNQIQTIPQTITKLSCLIKLNLKSNRIQKLQQIYGISTLQQLNIDNNKIKVITNSIQKLKYLQALSLQDNQITDISEKIGYLSKLKELYVQGNRLRSLPQSMARLKNMVVINFSRNWIESLPQQMFKNMKQLKQLWCHQNNLTKLPESLQNTPKLQLFHTYKNNLKTWPLISSQNLKQLDLSNNKQLKQFTKIKQFPNLQQLWLEQLNLLQIPIVICKNSIRKLNLNHNKIKCIPYQFCYLRNLLYLELKDNCLGELDGCMAELRLIQYVDVDGNCIKEIPKWVNHWKRLGTFYACMDTLTRLPNDILQCSKLVQFNCNKQMLDQSSLLVYEILRKRKPSQNNETKR